MATPSPAHSSAAKKAAGDYAAGLIQDGMRVGLGTGSTAASFISALVERHRCGLRVEVIATSERTQALAVKGGLPVLDQESVTSLDITVDGADEIDRHKRMIKGGGGALLREKIVASMSREMVVIIDESKQVPLLGKFPLPIEISPFAHRATIAALERKGYEGVLRMDGNTPYKTDSGHLIFDIKFHNTLEKPEHEESVIRTIPGVITTGFFFGLAGRVVVGQSDGTVQIIP